jgi:hypothetical protein
MDTPLEAARRLTNEELSERLRSQVAGLRQQPDVRNDPQRQAALVGLMACLEAPRRPEGKHEIRRVLSESLKLSAGLGPAERVRLLSRSFEAYAGELREAGDERTAQIADRAIGHCAGWIEAIEQVQQDC